MTSLPQHRASAQLTTVIARMFGKAVKFRHCPATVSAPANVSVLVEALEQGRISARACPYARICPKKPLKPNWFDSALGRWLKQRKSGDRSSGGFKVKMPSSMRQP